MNKAIFLYFLFSKYDNEHIHDCGTKIKKDQGNFSAYSIVDGCPCYHYYIKQSCLSRVNLDYSIQIKARLSVSWSDGSPYIYFHLWLCLTRLFIGQKYHPRVTKNLYPYSNILLKFGVALQTVISMSSQHSGNIKLGVLSTHSE